MPSLELARPVGVAVASLQAPGTFAGSFTDRTWVQQGLVTGLSVGSAYLATVLTQDLLALASQPLARLLDGPLAGRDPDRLALLLTDLAALPVGVVVLAKLPAKDDETLLRAAGRWSGRQLGATGLGTGVLGVTTAAAELADRALGRPVLSRLPLAVPAGLLLAAAVERRRATTHPETAGGESAADQLRSLAAAGGVVLLLGGATQLEGLVNRWGADQLSALVGGRPLTWQALLHVAAAGGLLAAGGAVWSRAMTKVEAGATVVAANLGREVADLWIDDTISGSPASLVSWESLGREGRRHAALYPRATPLPLRAIAGADGLPADLPDLSIPTVMGEPARATPVQVYVGLDAAPTIRERVQLALAEMDRTDAWSRPLIMLASPTGSGYLNYAATASAIYYTLGDIAIVTLQYSKRPSPLSLGKVSIAREQNRLLWLSIAQRVRDIPLDRRPRVVLFGESLGALTSQDVFMHWGTLGPEALGIDRGLWIGTPAFSKWSQQLVGHERPDVDRGAFAVVNDLEEFHALPQEHRRDLRFVLVSHDNDGVTKFSPDLLLKEPAWLGPDRPAMHVIPGRSPRGVPTAMRWRPTTTFLQTMVDMINAQKPGAYQAWGHDYRPDLPGFVREVYGLDVTDAQQAAVEKAVQQREEIRAERFS